MMMMMMMMVVVVVAMLFVTLQRILGLKFRISRIDSYGGGVGIVCDNRTSIMMVVPKVIMVPKVIVVVVVVTMLFAVLEQVLGLKSQISRIDSYGRGVGIVCGNRASIMMMVPKVIMVVVVVTMLFAALQRVLGLKLQISRIDSYGGGVGIVCDNRTSIMMVVPKVIMVPKVIVVVVVTMLFAAL